MSLRFRPGTFIAPEQAISCGLNYTANQFMPIHLQFYYSMIIDHQELELMKDFHVQCNKPLQNIVDGTNSDI
jgi:hypothetical protein